MSTRRTTLYLNALMDKTITFRIPVALLAKLEKLAQADERSVSFVLRKAVEQYVERHKEGK
jgi:predicted transcriptional regulator